MKNILFSFLLMIFFPSCFEEEEIKVSDPIYLIDVDRSVDTVFTDTDLPLEINFIPSSKERVFLSGNKDQELGSSYCCATRVNDAWKMWVVSRYKIVDNFNLSILQLTSTNNGSSYERHYTNNQYISVGNGSVIPYNQGASDFCVFYDPNLSRYKMIFQHIYQNNNKIYSPNCIIESADGVNWSQPVVFDSEFSDTQPGVVQKNEKYYLYMRHNLEGNVRCISVKAIDATTHKQVERKRILPQSSFVGFPHIYNNAALKMDETYTLFLPTIYNSETQECSIVWGYSEDNYNIKWGDKNISSIFIDTNKNKWFIVSPSLIPCDEPNHYWIYYYTRDAYHDEFMNATFSEYWRLKVKFNIKEPALQ